MDDKLQKYQDDNSGRDKTKGIGIITAEIDALNIIFMDRQGLVHFSDKYRQNRIHLFSMHIFPLLSQGWGELLDLHPRKIKNSALEKKRKNKYVFFS